MMNFSSKIKKAPEFKMIRELKIIRYLNIPFNREWISKVNKEDMTVQLSAVCRSLDFEQLFKFFHPAYTFFIFFLVASFSQNIKAADLRCLIGSNPQLKAECLAKGHWSGAINAPWVVAEKTTVSHFYSRGSFVLNRDVKKRAFIAEWEDAPILTEDAGHKTNVVRALNGKLAGECTGTVRLEILTEHEHYDDISVYLMPSGHLPCNHLSLQFADSPEEVFSGAGEQFTYLFLDGQQIDTLSQEQGHGKGKQPITWIGNKLGGGAGGREGNTYSGHPTLVSSAGRGLFVNDPYQVRIDLRSKGLLKIQTLVEKPMRLTLMHHIQPKEFTEEYTKRFGRMRQLPDWAHRGMMLGIQGGRIKIETALKKLSDFGSRLSSVWIQDWVGQRFGMFWQRLRWHWDVDRVLYPDWEELIKDLSSRGLKTVSYFNARFSLNKECGLNCDFHTVISGGYAIKALSGLPYLIGSGGFNFIKLDLTNADARTWFQRRMEQHAETGVQGWMTDFSESLPFDIRLFDLKSTGDDSAEEYHGNYIRDWAKLSRNVLDNAVGEEAFMMMRGGNQRSLPFVNSYWTGDQLETWDRFDGMHSALIGMISGGLSGMGITHSDIGGVIAFPALNYRRTEELYLRWLQMSAFTAIMRTHEGSNAEITHQFDSTEYSLKQTAFYSRLYASLFAYRKQLLGDYQQTGVPLMRPMFMENPTEKIAWSLDDQFYLGSDIIVAPVLRPGLKQRSVWLPKGVWINLFQGCEENILEGRFVEARTRLDEIPVFIRENTTVQKTLMNFIAEESKIPVQVRLNPCAIQ